MTPDPLDEVDPTLVDTWGPLDNSKSGEYAERYGLIRSFEGKMVPVVCLRDPKGSLREPQSRHNGCSGCVGGGPNNEERTEPKLTGCMDLPTCSYQYTYKVATRRNVALWLAQRMTT